MDNEKRIAGILREAASAVEHGLTVDDGLELADGLCLIAKAIIAEIRGKLEQSESKPFGGV